MDTPYEERIVEEETTFADFPNRVAPIAAGWNFEPMLPAFWSEVMRQTSRTPLLGERFAAARRAVERRWSCVQHEVPMSRVCQTEAFAGFACGIVAKLSVFHDDYNEVVRDYRRAHRIRSRNHPVPDLAVDGEWLEAPFWAWRRGHTRRGKLFVRKAREAWTLRIGTAEGPTLPNDPVAMTAAWRELEGQGIKIRSRALTTTMFARVYLADLFVHGIGGGIYDELTDRIIERFIGLPAPGFLVLSATMLLPLPRHPDADEQCRLRSRELRDLIYKPERFLQDRILFGTDSSVLYGVRSDDADGIKKWQDKTARFYSRHLEYFETDHANLVEPYGYAKDWLRLAGAKLPPEVLEKFYHGNAERLIPALRPKPRVHASNPYYFPAAA